MNRMSLMFTLTVLAAVVWALGFLPELGISKNVVDLFGGMAVGLFIGSVFIWFSERGIPR